MIGSTVDSKIDAQAKRRRCAKRRRFGRYGQPQSEGSLLAASDEAPWTTRSGLVADEAMSNLGGSPCAIAGMANRCFSGRPGPSISLIGADNLNGLTPLDESAFTPNWQMIPASGKLRSKLVRTSRCERITFADSSVSAVRCCAVMRRSKTNSHRRRSADRASCRHRPCPY